jgi:hypothetical protein
MAGRVPMSSLDDNVIGRNMNVYPAGLQTDSIEPDTANYQTLDVPAV